MCLGSVEMNKRKNPFRFYVYSHNRPGDGVPFYIGKGAGKRSVQKTHRNPYWHNIVNKYETYDIHILHENLTADDATCLEILLIWGWGRRDQNRGPLVNMTDGGDGASPAKATRLKMRNARLGKEPWNKGRTDVYSEEVLNDMKSRDMSHLHTQTAKTKARKALLKVLNKAIRCIETGVEYVSIKVAAKKHKTHASSISFHLHHPEQCPKVKNLTFVFV